MVLDSLVLLSEQFYDINVANKKNRVPMSDYKGSNSRECYRIEYPSKDLPVFNSGEAEYKVLNISEKSAKLVGGNAMTIELGQELRGTIRLTCGIASPVIGDVTRLFRPGAEFILLFKTRIPFKTIISEQRFLIGKYKHAKF
ncbi:MAG: hypothetical protein A2X93_03945 [Deltaproteobacteria bacterium GWC2_56_8]|nr:MAG: hypothetical protein A2X99_05395 [Deltaproteobacteria bacterium GWB2_55_19]OGP38993.1 MAG: hypothetical protein A2X93_03945 [Deltaproteobacteria bacterium GWC2_56_8]HAO93586.1 hypothetical protein [Deltaproteobacteria bacterium]